MWKTPVTVENAGRGGETIASTVGRLEAALEASKPDLVIWQVGTNDAVKGDDERRFAAILEQGIDAVQAAGVDLILLEQQFYPAIQQPSRYERFVHLVRTTAAREQVPVFLRYKLMKDWAERSGEALSSMLAADRFHMGDRGYDCIAQLIAAGIHAVVAAQDSVSGAAEITAAGQ